MLAVSFRTHDGAHYLCAEGGGGRELVANRRGVSEWETFTIRSIADPKAPITHGTAVAIQVHTGHYLTARNGGGSDLIAQAPWIKPWEHFTLERVDGPGELRDGDRIGFRTLDGHYLYAQDGGGGEVTAASTWLKEWETFTARVSLLSDNVRFRLELVNVSCRDTEDNLGADEFYLIGAVMTDTGVRKGIVTTPLSINDGQTQGFHTDQILVLDEVVPRDEWVALWLRAYDEDVAKDWSRRPEWMNAIGVAVAGAGGKAIASALVTNPVGWGIIGGIVAAAAAAGGVIALVGSDVDDQLGELHAVIPAAGHDDVDHTWSFRQEGFISSWDYTVSYRLRRESA